MNRVQPSARLVEKFSGMGRAKVYTRGTVIFRQGEDVSGMWLIRSGWIRLVRITFAGRTRTLRLIGPEGLLGVVELMVGRAHMMTAEVIDEVEVVYLSRNEVMAVLAHDVAMAEEFLALLGEEARAYLMGWCVEAGDMPMVERLLYRLREVAEVCGQPGREGVRLQLPFTVQDLAESVGCTRQWASRLLRELEEQGVIRRRRGWITLLPAAFTGDGMRR